MKPNPNPLHHDSRRRCRFNGPSNNSTAPYGHVERLATGSALDLCWDGAAAAAHRALFRKLLLVQTPIVYLAQPDSVARPHERITCRCVDHNLT
jgi:hypothetical protein